MDRLLRLKDIIGDPNADPPISPIIPISRASWYQGIKDGHFPQPVKLGPRTSAWKESSINTLIEQGVP